VLRDERYLKNAGAIFKVCSGMSGILKMQEQFLRCGQNRQTETSGCYIIYSFIYLLNSKGIYQK